MLDLPTISTLPLNTPAMYRSPSRWPLFQTGVLSRRLMQWTELASGAVKTTLPSTTAGGVDFQLESVELPSTGVGMILLGGGNGWNGPPNWLLLNGGTWLCSRYGYDQTRARFMRSTPKTSPALVGQTRMPSPNAKCVALVRRDISKATRFCG